MYLSDQELHCIRFCSRCCTYSGKQPGTSVLVACPVQWGNISGIESGKCHPKLPRVVACGLWEDTLRFGGPSPGKEVTAAGCVWTAPFFLWPLELSNCLTRSPRQCPKSGRFTNRLSHLREHELSDLKRTHFVEVLFLSHQIIKVGLHIQKVTVPSYLFQWKLLLVS